VTEAGRTPAGDASWRDPATDEPTVGGGFVREVVLRPGRSMADEATAPALAVFRHGLALHPAVTFLVGENGSGKSTLVEAIAIAMGLNPEGGGSGWRYRTRASHFEVGRDLLVTRGTRTPPLNRFFLRAESVYTLATAIEQGANVGEGGLEAYGDVSLHEQSHGESFLALLHHRFGPRGFFVMDEPESALSPQNELTLLRGIHELVLAGGQLVIATHSPILVAYPHARILLCEAGRVRTVGYDDVPAVRVTRAILADPGRALEGPAPAAPTASGTRLRPGRPPWTGPRRGA
jgi:predicted ATPase